MQTFSSDFAISINVANAMSILRQQFKVARVEKS